MAWSKVYTSTIVDAAAKHNFYTYLYDTYLPTKTGWATGAHPDASSFKRKLSFTANSVVTGANHTTYWWVDWGSSTNPGNMLWRGDTTYTSVPGDLCTDTQLSRTGVGFGTSSDATIWESGDNSQEFAVFYGRTLFFYWPAITNTMCWDNGGWDGTGTTFGNRTWLWPGGRWGTQYSNPAYCAGTSGSTNSNMWYLNPDCGFDTSSMASSPQGSLMPIMFGGIQWMTTEFQNATQGSLAPESHPMTNRGPADTLFKYAAGGTGQDLRWVSTSDNATTMIIQDTTSGKWYIHCNTNINENTLCFDCGLVEPVL